MITKLIMWLMLWFYAILYGTLVLFKLLKDIVTDGPKKVFHKTKRERPSCLQDAKFGTHSFLHLEDVRIHYVATGPEDKPLMLFVHGFPDFWYSWRNQLEEFSKDYRCVAIDMRGYGESDKPSGKENYAMKYLMKDIQQVIGGLGYKSCVLVSHDWGGAVGWSFARLFPDYVDRLIVLNCPPNPVFRKLIRSDKDQFKKSWYMFFFQLPFLPEFLLGTKDYGFFDSFGSLNPDQKSLLTVPWSDEEIEAYKYTFSQPGALTGPLNFYRAAMRCKPVNYDMKYTVPVLLIWGKGDMALSDKIPVNVQKENAAIVVKTIEKGGHFVQNDAPDEVNKAIREWLTSF